MSALVHPRPSPLLWLIPVGGLAAALSVLVFGLWTLPALLIGAIAAIGIFRVDWALTAVVFLLPFTALEGMASGYHQIVQDFRRVLLVWLACAWILHVILTKREVVLPSKVAAAIAVFSFAALASVLRADEPMIALTSTARLIMYCVVYIVLVIDLVRTPAAVWQLARVLLVSGALTASFAIYQLAAHFVGLRTFLNPSYLSVYAIPRVHSWMAEPLMLSNFLLLTFPIALALFSWRRRRWTGLAFVAAVLCLMGIIIAASRAGWGILGVTFLLFPLLSAPHARRSRMVQVTAIVLVLAGGAASTLWLRNFGSGGELLTYVTQFATFADADTGAGDLNGRIQNLRLAGRAFETSPLIGIGTNNVGFRFHQYMTIEGPKISSSGNTYLDTWLETGTIGAAAFISLVVLGLMAAWRGFKEHRSTPEGALCFGLLLGLLGSALHINFFGSLTWSSHLFFAIGFAIAARRAFHSPLAPSAS